MQLFAVNGVCRERTPHLQRCCLLERKYIDLLMVHLCCIGVVIGITILAPDRDPDPAVDIIAGDIIREADRDPGPGIRIRTEKEGIHIEGDHFRGLDRDLHHMIVIAKRVTLVR